MEFEIIKEKDMPLLARKRITLNATFQSQATPSAATVRTELAKKMKVKENLVAIRHIYQHFGGGNAKVIAHVYKNLEDLKALEKKKAVMEEKKEEAKPEAPAEAPKEETPKEEPKAEEVPKEEAPQEEKTEEKVEESGKEETKE
jgi:ribosomal protein S24E